MKTLSFVLLGWILLGVVFRAIQWAYKRNVAHSLFCICMDIPRGFADFAQFFPWILGIYKGHKIDMIYSPGRDIGCILAILLYAFIGMCLFGLIILLVS